MAGAFKKAADAGGVIALADEVGFLMNPSVKRTWAPSGVTPAVAFRNRHHKKVSVLGAVVLHAATGRVELVCDFHPDAYVRAEQAAAFLHRLLAEYPGVPVNVVWDNLQAHKAPIVREVADAEPGRLTLHYLPPYAPDLNPVEHAWCVAKHHRMANHAIADVQALHATARRHLDDIGRDQGLLRACFDGAELALSIPSAQ